MLETARGLGSPSVANVVRVAAFQAALERLDGPPRFWTRSLQVDAWAAARTLLGWHDELVAAEWSAHAEWLGVRLSALAVAVRLAEDLPVGTADRLRGLALDLASLPRLPIRRLRLVDARPLHPAGWRRVIDLLERCGVEVEEIAATPAAPRNTALGRLQR